MLEKAVFLDRDGVIIKPIYDEKREQYRPPWTVSEVELMPNVIKPLQEIYNKGYSLFIVTNQPDFAKGFVSLDILKEIRKYIFETLIKNDIGIRNNYYCFHHPNKCPCECRKPSPYFLLEASKTYNLNLKKSWMIGDRETDIVCGKEAGTRTIKLGNTKSNLADFTGIDLKEAIEIIKFCENIKKRKNDNKNK